MAAVELVRYNDLGNGDFQVQVAVDGILAPMIDDHQSHKETFRNDEDYFKWVGWMSKTLIHLYGDARYSLPAEEMARREKEGF